MAAFLGIAVTAQYAGFGPAICSLILGGFLACYFFLIPVGTLAIASWGDFTGLVLYFVVGTVIVLLSEWQSNAYKLAEERQARLAGEVQKHRETADELRLQRDRLASAEEVLQRTHRILEERVEQLQTTHRHLEEHVKQLQTELTNHTQKEYQLRDERDRLAVAERELQQTKNDLLERLAELQQFEEAVVGRELKMIEMEKELERLHLSRKDGIA
jgi:K+-sensing histidine kinase KdpD